MGALARILVIAAIGWGARSARADVGVVVTGEPGMQGFTIAQVQGWLQDHGYALIAAPLGDKYHTFIDCFVIEDLKCARKAFETESKAGSLVFTRVDLVPSEQGRQYAVTGYWFVRQRDPIILKRACPQCDDAALQLIIAELMVEMARATGLAMGRVEINSAHPGQPGMVVMLDHVNIGVTPIARDVAPGRHEVEFRYQGRHIGTSSITVEAGKTLEVRSPRVIDEDVPAGRLKVLPMALIGGGVAAIAAASVFLYYGQKDGPDEPYVYTNATPIGAVTGILGIGSIALGAVIWPRTATAGTPTISVAPGTAGVGWVKQF